MTIQQILCYCSGEALAITLALTRSATTGYDKKTHPFATSNYVSRASEPHASEN